jgi:hypothetical protein
MTTPAKIEWCPQCHGQRYTLKPLRVEFGSADRYQPLITTRILCTTCHGTGTNPPATNSMKTPTPLTIALEVLGAIIFFALSLALYFLAA